MLILSKNLNSRSLSFILFRTIWNKEILRIIVIGSIAFNLIRIIIIFCYNIFFFLLFFILCSASRLYFLYFLILLTRLFFCFFFFQLFLDLFEQITNLFIFCGHRFIVFPHIYIIITFELNLM